ncbi:MAG: hypothetical protein C7B45_14920 [Sulfobacillus acidophilus]|uniref:Photosynthesis system II assembly factor Ycf48/Hcf136-like domain-containing protein n=1 Tax=Sulfobacillus acidophilus TaxID=53633 RepID=A0A2T2WDY6_9FIRM|nr:MAG: hypothetical protein C7B45_14920 [Sulfobacillus acidophilus]
MRIARVVLMVTLLMAALVGASGLGAAPLRTIASIQPGRPAIVHNTQPALASQRILATTFLTAQQGFLSGTQVSGQRTVGFVDGTDNGGVTWHLLGQTSGIALSSLRFVSAKAGWALGESIEQEKSGLSPRELFDTTNGGRTWTPVITALAPISSLVITPAGVPWISINGPCNKTACSGSVMTPVNRRLATVWRAPGPVIALAWHHAQMTAEVALGTSKSQALTVQLYRRGSSGSWTPVGTPLMRYGSMGPPTQYVPLAGQLLWTSNTRALASVFSIGSCAMGGCGISEVVQTQDSGQHWSLVKSVQIGCQFEPLLAGRADHAVVVQNVNLAACAGPGTDLFVTNNGGLHFTRPMQWPQTAIASIGVGKAGMLWAVANGTSVIISRDGGQQWIQRFPSPTPSGSLVSVNSQVAYGAGDQSNPAALLKTINGGITWHVQASLGMREAVAVAVPSPQDEWVAAVPVPGEFNISPVWLHSTDGGRHWSKAAGSPAAHQTFYPVIRFFSSRQALWINLPANCAGSCPAFGAKTRNGGVTWQPLRGSNVPPNIVSAAIVSPHTIIVATLGVSHSPAGIYETTNTGQSWHRLSALPARLNGAFDLAFPTPRIGYMVVNNVTRPANKKDGQPQKALLAILKTTDGGRVWTLHNLPHIPDNYFSSITFINPQSGLLDADGLIWKTTNGGISWTEMP